VDFSEKHFAAGGFLLGEIDFIIGNYSLPETIKASWVYLDLADF